MVVLNNDNNGINGNNNINNNGRSVGIDLLIAGTYLYYFYNVAFSHLAIYVLLDYFLYCFAVFLVSGLLNDEHLFIIMLSILLIVCSCLIIFLLDGYLNYDTFYVCENLTVIYYFFVSHSPSFLYK